MPAGQIASIPASLSSGPTSTLTMTWCASTFPPSLTWYTIFCRWHWQQPQVLLTAATRASWIPTFLHGPLRSEQSTRFQQVHFLIPGYLEAPAFLVQHGCLRLLLLPACLQEVRLQREDHPLHWGREALVGRGGFLFSTSRGWA